jgi:hypothetical protein
MFSLTVAPATLTDAYGVGADARRAAVIAAASFMTPWHAAAAANAAEVSGLRVATKHNQLSVPRSSPPA